MMRNIIERIIVVIHILSLLLAIILGAIGLVYEILGTNYLNSLFAKLGFIGSYEIYWVVSISILAVLIITGLTLKKLFKD